MTEQSRQQLPDKEKERLVQRHLTLSMCLMRAQTVGEYANLLAPRVIAAELTALELREETLQVRPSDSIKGLQAMWLYLACLQIAVEQWTDHPATFKDSHVDDLLSHPEHPGYLKGLRSKVFHPYSPSHPAYRKLFDEWDPITVWADELFLAMVAYSRAWFAAHYVGPRPPARP